jgi:putative two-component system response regulator
MSAAPAASPSLAEGIEALLAERTRAEEARIASASTEVSRAEAAIEAAPAVRLLVVDDDRTVCLALARHLRRAGYAVDEAYSGREALDRLRSARYGLLLCDVRMPGFSGLDVIPEALGIDEDVAVIMLSGEPDAPTATAALRAGALHFLTKPLDMEEFFAAVRESLEQAGMRAERRRIERLIREEVASRTAELEQEKAALRTMTVGVAEALINAMEAKDTYLSGHSQRVADLAAAIADVLGLEPEVVEAVRLAGRLHDVGKIGIQESVLNKPGKLTPEEFAHVREHVRIGMNILGPLEHLGDVLTWVHHHHEHWDGGGYPQRLRGTEISLGGRILTAADTYDALTSARAYREPLTQDAALALLVNQKGKLLDPAVLEALLVVVRGR